jgi:hypothetical protein
MLCIRLFKRQKVNLVQATRNGIALDRLYEVTQNFAPGTLNLNDPAAQETFILNGPVAQQILIVIDPLARETLILNGPEARGMLHTLKVKDTMMTDI